MDKLDKLRTELDKIDAQMIRLYEQRMAVCEKVGEVKIEEGRKVFDKQREREKLNCVTKNAKDAFFKKGLT